MNLVITIDGPSGSGKGTTARGLAKKLSLPHIDSGSVYRATAHYLHSKGIGADDTRVPKLLDDLSISYDASNRVLINGIESEENIRSRETSKIAFKYSRNPLIREFATTMQRELLRDGGILDGRDAGTVVAPDADLKIYLDCDIEERLRRRVKQHNVTDPKEIKVLREEIIDRDESDSKNSGSLEVLPESVIVDTSGMSVEEQIDAVYRKALEIQ